MCDKTEMTERRGPTDEELADFEAMCIELAKNGEPDPGTEMAERLEAYREAYARFQAEQEEAENEDEGEAEGLLDPISWHERFPPEIIRQELQQQAVCCRHVDRDELDPGIVPLVEALNRLDGIFTFCSCAGHSDPEGCQTESGRFFIHLRLHEFSGVRSLATIVDAIARVDSHSGRTTSFSIDAYDEETEDDSPYWTAFARDHHENEPATVFTLAGYTEDIPAIAEALYRFDEMGSDENPYFSPDVARRMMEEQDED